MTSDKLKYAKLFPVMLCLFPFQTNPGDALLLCHGIR